MAGKPYPEAPKNAALHKVESGQYDNLLERIQAIAKSMNIPSPGVWVAESKSLQAEAFPSNNIAITTATLKLLNPREQNAILAHELGHRKNGDKDGLAGMLQLGKLELTGHLPEYRETLADDRAVEAAYSSRLFTPDDLSTALVKMSARKTADHGAGAMNGGLAFTLTDKLLNALPQKAQETINSISNSLGSFKESIHLDMHPSIENRIEHVNQLKQAHEKKTVNR
jgi:Zn-dependent protease with chaperone function